MANSPGSAERRARLIREMARPSERSHSRSSAASSMQSAQLEAQYDTETQQLPALQPEPDFQINTSALRRAFPDFSQYGSSEEDSIEFGRGVKRSARNASNNILPSLDVSENLSLDLGPAGMYRIVGTPPMKPRDMNAQSNLSASKPTQTNASSRRNTSTKENDDPLAKTTDFVSGSSNKGSSKGSHNSNRSLAEMRARVESDDSGVLSDERPLPVTANTKNTRFSARRARQTSTLTNAPSYRTDGLHEADPSIAKAQQHPQSSHNHTNTSNLSVDNETHQSYLLPDIANITELVSGSKQDGTPTLQRSAKGRSRFGTSGQPRRPSGLKQVHVPIDDVPVPAEQKALQLCLQLLQDKVAQLETHKANSEKAIDDYELEVLQLRSKLEEHEHRQDNSIRSVHGEVAQKSDWNDEKSALENSLKALQDRLDRANRKLSASEVTINNLTRDRQAAHQQLEVAHVNSEELRNESLAVRDEIQSVKHQVARLTREHETRIERLTLQETELRAKIERRERAINEMGSLANELWATRRLLNGSTSYVNNTIDEETQDQPEEDPTQTARSLSKTQNSVRPSSSTHHRTQSLRRTLEDNTTGHLSNPESTTDIREPSGPQTMRDEAKDATYLSFMAGDEIPKMRRLLEEDQALLTNSRGHAYDGSRNVSSRIDSRTHTIPRKSSLKHSQNEQKQHLKAVTASETDPNHGQVVRDDEPRSTNVHPVVSFPQEKEDTQRSIFSQRSDRPRRSTTGVLSEVTSAFILPDITLTGGVLSAQRNSSNPAGSGPKTVTVPRPSPVSDRMPVPGPGEEDATIRPAQPPGLALATVLKGLDDELAQLRAQLARQEELYHQHDPSLSKRKRKVVLAKIQKLLAAIDMRADQIYALYDVLEGQKEKGQLMPENEVEVTLQSIGIDAATARNMNGARRRSGLEGSDVEDLISEGGQSGSENGQDDEESLPWEGFEATQTQTLGSLRSGLRMH